MRVCECMEGQRGHKRVCVCVCFTHPGDIAWSELNCAKQAQYDDQDVNEVGQDGSPLVA